MKKQKVLRVLNESEKSKLFDIENKHHVAIMVLLYNTGLRIGELTGEKHSYKIGSGEIRKTERPPILLKDVFNFSKDKITSIKNQVTIVGKGNKQRTIPLNDQSKEAIKTLLEHNLKTVKVKIAPETPLLVSKKKTAMTRTQVSRIIKKIREDLNIDLHLTPHVFRHQFCTEIYKKTGNIKVVQTLAGHSSVKTTLDIYSHVTTEDLKNAVDTL